MEADPDAGLETAVSLFRDLLGGLRARIEATRAPPDREVIDLGKIRARQGAIDSLRRLHQAVRDLGVEVGRVGAEAEALHQAELAAARSGLAAAQGGAPGSSGAPWASGAPGPSGAPGASPARAPAPRAAPGLVALHEGVSLRAIVVPPGLRSAREVAAAVAAGGGLHYIASWRHFAVKIGDCLFHANLGHLYWGPPRGAKPCRVRPCRREACRAAGAGADGCAFYHDPADFRASTEARNFLAEGWLYSPAATPSDRGARHFGSRDELAADLAVVSAEDARLFIDQTAHDLLCALVLWNYVARPGGPDA